MNKIKKDSFLINVPISHRGLHSKEVPENSIPAFQSCIEAKYAIETDLRLTKDNQVIVFHDETAKRMCRIDKKIIDMDLADIKTLPLKNSDEKIPTLEEFLNLVDGKVGILIEIKNEKNPGVLEDIVIAKLKNYTGEFAIQSFNPKVIDYFRINAENFIRGQLACYFKREKLAFYKKFLLKRMFLNRKTKPDFISYCIKDIPNRFVKKYSNLPLLVWTVRTKQDLEKANIFTANVIFENPSIFW